MSCAENRNAHGFRLEEEASRAVGQNFLLARDLVLLLETAANLCATRRQANDFYAVFSSFYDYYAECKIGVQ